MLCKECKHLKEKTVGRVSAVFWCNASDGKAGNKLGVHPWIEKVHPKCPLKINKKEGK